MRHTNHDKTRDSGIWNRIEKKKLQSYLMDSVFWNVQLGFIIYFTIFRMNSLSFSSKKNVSLIGHE